MRPESFRRAISACFLFLSCCLAHYASAQTPVQSTLALLNNTPTYVDTVTGVVSLTGTTTTPTGTVSYQVDGGASSTATVSGGSAWLDIAAQKPGSHTVSWTYSGDASNQGASGSKGYTVSDMPAAVVGSTYPLKPLIYTQVEGNGYSAYGASGVAVDAQGNTFLSFGNSGSTVAPSVAEITANLEYKVLPVSGLGTDTQLALDAAGNLYVADPTHSRIVEYTAGGVQQVVSVSGLQTPASVTFEAASNSLYILDKGLGSVVRYDLTHSTQSTLFSVAGMDTPIATDGQGNVYYGVGQHLYLWSGAGGTHEISSQFYPPSPLAQPTIQSIAYDVNQHTLWFAVGGVSSTADLFALDSKYHLLAFMDAGQSSDNASHQITTDSNGHAFGTILVFTLGNAINGGPTVNLQTGGEVWYSMNYATTGSTVATQAYGAQVLENPHPTGTGLGATSWPYALVIPGTNQQLNVPVYGKGYGVWDAVTPGSTASLQATPTQPGGIANVDPFIGFGDNVYVTDTASNTVTYLQWTPAQGAPLIYTNKTLGFTGLQQPTQVAADGANDVWVMDKGGAGGTSRIVELNSAGVQTVAYPPVANTDGISSATAFAQYGNNLYVAGNNGKGVIERFDGVGVLKIIAANIDTPVALAVYADENVYAEDAGGTLIRVDRSGKITTVASSLPVATELSVLANGTVYLSSAAAADVLTIAPDGTQTHLAIPGTTNPAYAVTDDLGDVSFIDGSTKTANLNTRSDYVEQDFGNVALNTTGKIDFSITNVGNLSVGTLTGFNSPPFSLIGAGTSPCVLSGSTTLAPGQSCGLEMQYTPTKQQTDTGQIGLRSVVNGVANCCDILSDLFDLTGKGSNVVTAPNPLLTPPSIDFGNVTVSTTTPAKVATLSNIGNATLNLMNINLVGGNAASFAETNTCGTSVGAGLSCTISITCTPGIAGNLSAILAVNYPSPQPQQTVALTCTGMAATATAPQAALTPGSADFGTVTVGTSSTNQTFTLSNAGNAALPVRSIGITGADASSFTIGSNNCGTSLGAGTACAVVVSFKAAASGAAMATLTVIDSVGTQTSSLTGTGASVGTPDFTVSATPATQSTHRGSTVTYTVQVASANNALPFTSVVSLSATGLPAGATATFSPSSVTPGSSQATSTFTVTTAAQNARSEARKLQPFVADISAASLLCLVGFASMRRRRGLRIMLVLLIGLAGAVSALTGCGGGTGFAIPGTTSSSTTSTITITGTSGSTVHTATVTLALQ